MQTLGDEEPYDASRRREIKSDIRNLRRDWMCLSTVLDDYSRHIVSWKPCSTMRAEDVTDTLDMALAASGCDQTHVRHRLRLLSDNGPSNIAG